VNREDHGSHNEPQPPAEEKSERAPSSETTRVKPLFTEAPLQPRAQQGKPTVIYTRDTAKARKKILIRTSILLLILAVLMLIAYKRRGEFARAISDLLAPEPPVKKQSSEEIYESIIEDMRRELLAENFGEDNLQKVKQLFAKIPDGTPFKSEAESLYKRGECKILSTRAREHEENERWDEAAALLAKAAQCDPSDLEVRRRLKDSERLAKMKKFLHEGQTFLQLGKRDKALACFERALDVANQTNHPKAAQYRTEAKKLLNEVKLYDFRVTCEKEAEQAFNKGDYIAEAAIFRKLAEKLGEPYISKAKYAELLARGQQAADRGDLDIAEHHLSKIPRDDRHFPAAQKLLAAVRAKKEFLSGLDTAERCLNEAKLDQAIRILENLRKTQPENYKVADLLKEARAVSESIARARDLRQQGKHYEAMKQFALTKKTYKYLTGVVDLCDREIKISQPALEALMRDSFRRGTSAWSQYRRGKLGDVDIFNIERNWAPFQKQSKLLAEAYGNLLVARDIALELCGEFDGETDFAAIAAEIKSLTKKLFDIAYQYENVLRDRQKALMYYRAVVQFPRVEGDEYWKIAEEKLKTIPAREQPAPAGTK